MNRLTDNEWLLLSRYLDGDLSAEQQRELERKLRSDEAYKEAYDRLMHTRMVLRSVPQRRVPRTYLLSEEIVKEKRPRRSAQLFWQYSSVAAALVAVLSLALQLFSSPMSGMSASVVEEQSETFKQEAAVPDEQASTEESPPIIVWNPAPAGGMGGGGDTEQSYEAPQTAPKMSLEGYGIGGGAPVEATELAPLDEALDMGPGGEVPLPESSTTADDAPETMLAEETPLPGSSATADGVPESTLAEEAPMLESESAPETQSEAANPILGIAPEEERGSVGVDEAQVEEQAQAKPPSEATKYSLNFVNIAIGATLFSAVGALISFILRKKQP